MVVITFVRLATRVFEPFEKVRPEKKTGLPSYEAPYKKVIVTLLRT